ncbi:hypothetical protein QU487_17230 [Crenobacter sp. SG2305]|uniref:hypothetical protein n=1 Tax=Crenobacter oryzisoli TaxID=3056844 RepID=UPI0025AA5086|nr:hypothetical protein [Crenobacter sp. SG2305]MDN0084482.1 hypothetical protein [Crenobacter sp. SG2305]
MESQNNSTKKLDISEQNEFLIIPRQTTASFALSELCVYASQIIMFFFVAALSSNLLRDEKQLVEYMNSKINGNTMYEIGATMIAIAATVGIIAAISKAAPRSSLLERLADEVLTEAPRTAYVFGSSVAGTFLAAAFFLSNHPETKAPPIGFWLLYGFLAAVIGFLYGYAFAYAFKHKAFIKTNAHLPTPSPPKKIETSDESLA